MGSTILDDTVTVTAASHMLRLSPGRIRQMADDGELPVTWTPLGRLLDKAAVERLVEQRAAQQQDAN
jgi:hypothetical protein